MTVPVLRQPVVPATGVLFVDGVLRPWSTAIGSARQWLLPNFSGDVPVVDSNGYVIWGGGSGPPSQLAFRGYQEGYFRYQWYDPLDTGAAGERTIGGLLIQGAAPSGGLIKTLGRVKAVATDAAFNNSYLDFEIGAGGAIALRMRLQNTGLRLERVLLGALTDTFTCAIESVSTKTANRTHLLQDKDGTLAHTSDITGIGTSQLANDAVTNAKMANMATQTIKGRIATGTGDPQDLTGVQARTVLGVDTSSSGEYTPTLTAVSNVSSVSPLSCHWMRVGDTVTVGGSFVINTSAGASTSTTVGVSLPIVSGLTLQNHCGGTCCFIIGTGLGPGLVRGDVANDQAEFVFPSPLSGAGRVHFTFSYRVL